MEKTRVAVIGLGGISQIMHLPILSKCKDAELTAVCDKETTKSKVVAKRYNLPAGYREVDKMLEDNESIDAVIVATTTNAHLETVIKCLEAGKHVLVEKPVAMNAAEVRKMTDAAEKNRKIFMVGMNNRFRTDTMLQRNFIKGKELGDIFYVKTGWLKSQSSNQKWFTVMDKAGGGVFMDNGIVMLDLGMWMLGFPEVKSVSAVNYRHNSKAVEDSNVTFVRFHNNASLTIEVSWSFLRYGEFFYCNAFGTNGSTAINPLKISKVINKELFDITPKNIKQSPAVFKNSFENQMNYFIGAIRGTHTPISTGKEALAVMEIADAIYKSAESGREVFFKKS
ncbi:MAG: Gfo/Idh/MocA family oxidoreductase [Ignavibacteria bacterium]|jgi:predicted dehydrogenase|nr:Gfo/Idh/MocA family oxidoreductase [Ignavibacteria bacterium]